jgi:hypothetical protein
VLLLRVVVSTVYLTSGGTKALDADWRSGLVLWDRTVRHQHLIPFDGWVHDLLTSRAFHHLLSPGAIAIELFLAAALWLPRTRVAAIWVALVFHGSIELVASVQTFSYSAIAALLIWVTPRTRDRALIGSTGPFATWVRRLDWLEQVPDRALPGDADDADDAGDAGDADGPRPGRPGAHGRRGPLARPQPAAAHVPGRGAGPGPAPAADPVRRSSLGGPVVTRQHGPRAQVLGRLRDRLAGGVPANPAHPAPAPQATAPAPRFRVVDPDDLVGTFVRTATEAGATVHRAAVADPSEVPPDLLDPGPDPGQRSRGRGAHPGPRGRGPRRRAGRLGVTCAEHDPPTAATAALGVTGSVAAVAATGSVVLDAARAGGRGASLLPPMHLCVVRASTVVATPGDVLRAIGTGAPPPSNLVLVTGPSRTGDIEQILTVGVHGPAAVHVVVLDGSPDPRPRTRGHPRSGGAGAVDWAAVTQAVDGPRC